MRKLIALDIGSSSIKACLFGLDDEIRMLYSETEKIGLYSPKPDYAQHDANEVFEAVCKAIRNVVSNSGIPKEEINLISICSQAQCVVLVDKEGNALTPIYNSQDGRAMEEFNRYFADGLIRVDGVNLFKVAGVVLSTGFTPGTAKDPVFKFKWVEDHLPEIYKKSYKWLDIKDYVLQKLTGEFVTTKDNAHAFTIYNSKENKGNWGKTAAKIFKVDMHKLPNVKDSTDVIGCVLEELIEKCGLAKGTKVIGGIIDSTGVQYGSGAADVGEAMVYWGTSGWVGTVTDCLKINFIDRMGALISAKEDRFHYFATLDSAGISFEWLKKHIIEDDGFILRKEESGQEDNYEYDDMNNALLKVAPGSDGLMYAPWITGCRAPVEASDIGGMFVGLKYFMDKKYFVRAVVEGICFQYRLLLELSAKQTGKITKVRFVGGGGESDEISQILSDITGCTVEVPNNPRYAGAIGAAIVGFCAMDETGIDIIQMAHRQKAVKSFTPNAENHKLYNKYYAVFKTLYRQNKKILNDLSSISKDSGK